MSGRLVLLALAALVAGCAGSRQRLTSAAAAAAAVIGTADVAMLARLVAPVRRRLALPPAAQRADMASAIRTTVRQTAPAADTPAFERALGVVATIPRERFVLPAGRRFAYLDLPQQIGWGQTISDPYIVTLMTAALDLPPHATVLDVGAGSGYQAAVLSPLADRVFSIEIVDPLARAAAARLTRLRYGNIAVRSGDGFGGWPEHAPFDGVIVAAGAAAAPAPLIAQLRPGGRLVMPIGPTELSEQLLILTKRADGGVTRCSLGWAMFVPLTGAGRRSANSRGLLDRTIPLCYGVAVS